MVLRLGACGTSTGGGMTLLGLEAARRWPVVIVRIGRILARLKMSVILTTYDACVCLGLNKDTRPTIHGPKGPMGRLGYARIGPVSTPLVGVNRFVV